MGGPLLGFRFPLKFPNERGLLPDEVENGAECSDDPIDEAVEAARLLFPLLVEEPDPPARRMLGN